MYRWRCTRIPYYYRGLHVLSTEAVSFTLPP